MARPLHPRLERHPATRRDRGAAMLIVMVTIAILSALTVDLAYETRVRLQIAGNARDELRAEALAKSAINLSRLVLGSQQQIDQSMGQACQVVAGLAGTAGLIPPPAGGTAAACPLPQIWSLIPVNSGLAGALFGQGAAPGKAGADMEETGAKAATATFGDFEGAFEAKIEDEGRKVNLQLDALENSGLLGPRVDGLLRLPATGAGMRSSTARTRTASGGREPICRSTCATGSTRTRPPRRSR
jgi:general secretion pathway protein K